jgi:NAD-dependent deacetylase
VKTKIIVLTGAGISAESGLKTFRDSDGLWEGYDIYDVATPEAWHRNPDLVQEFYNMRRKAVLEAEPNAAHLALKRLEEKFEVVIITQNVDNLHERAGSSNILHLHGIVTRSQSSANPSLTYDMEGWELKMGEICELGSQLRPHVVWFGEPVPMMETAAQITSTADVFIVIGTSLAVYPAASLIDFVPQSSEKIIVDPNSSGIARHQFRLINATAGEAVPQLVDDLLMKY